MSGVQYYTPQNPLIFCYSINHNTRLAISCDVAGISNCGIHQSFSMFSRNGYFSQNVVPSFCTAHPLYIWLTLNDTIVCLPVDCHMDTAFTATKGTTQKPLFIWGGGALLMMNGFKFIASQIWAAPLSDVQPDLGSPPLYFKILRLQNTNNIMYYFKCLVYLLKEHMEYLQFAFCILTKYGYPPHLVRF